MGSEEEKSYIWNTCFIIPVKANNLLTGSCGMTVLASLDKSEVHFT